MCKRCVMDNTDPDITFDENSSCNHCTEAIRELSRFPYNLTEQQKEEELKKIISTIKKSGSKRKKYDCVVGVSGFKENKPVYAPTSITVIPFVFFYH